MKEIVISSTLPVINGNFDEIKAELKNQLKQFDLIVDESSVKTAKSMATQINKLSNEIDALRKKEIAKLSAPLKDFEAKMKELKNLCQDSRQNLLSQVKVYDEKRLAQVKELLLAELQNAYIHYGVKKEFQTLKIDDMVMLTNLTKGGALTKKAKDAIGEKVSKIKQLQEKIDTRLLTLEAICFKSGLNTPLTRENINHFLMVDSNDEYLDKLTSLIHNELRRLQESEARRARVEEGVATNITVSQNNSAHQQQTQPQQKQSITQRFKNAKEFLPQKKKFIVTATFEVEVDENMGEKLEAMMLQKFRLSGFKTTPKVTVLSVQ